VLGGPRWHYASGAGEGAVPVVDEATSPGRCDGAGPVR